MPHLPRQTLVSRRLFDVRSEISRLAACQTCLQGKVGTGAQVEVDTPRLVAIEDVQIRAPAEELEATIAFYEEIIGFERLETDDGDEDDQRVELRGYPISGPRLVLRPGQHRQSLKDRPPVIVQVASLFEIAEQLAERYIPCEWSRGWFHFDRRLLLTDPGGNRLELVAYHSW